MSLIDTADVNHTLSRIEQLLSVLVRHSLRSVIREELATEKARQVYDLTGTGTVREIAEAAQIGIGTVSEYWARWEALGLVSKDGARYRKTFEQLSATGELRRPARSRSRAPVAEPAPFVSTVNSGDAFASDTP